MTTATDIIKGALRRLQIIGSETPIEADEIADGLEDLNDWASAIETGKLSLGFVPVGAPADTVNIPREAVAMYKDNLAIYIAGQYGAPVSQTLIKSADDSMRLALNTFQPLIDAEYPDSLPLGSGNHCDTYDQEYFPNNSANNF